MALKLPNHKVVAFDQTNCYFEAALYLSQFHALSGCDTTAYFYFCGKKQHDRVPRPRGYHLEYDGEAREDQRQLLGREEQGPVRLLICVAIVTFKIRKESHQNL